MSLAGRIRRWAKGSLSRKRNVSRADFLHDGKWNYEYVDQFAYGDETSYRKGMAYLDGHGVIEDWGCGTAWAKRYVTKSTYIGIDSSKSRFADKVVDLRSYTRPPIASSSGTYWSTARIGRPSSTTPSRRSSDEWHW